MDVGLCRASSFEDALGFRHLVCCTMSDNEKLGRFDRRLVLHDTVLRNANAVKRYGQGTQSANYHSAFQSPENPTCKRAEHKEGADARDNEKGRPKQQAPKAAPKGPLFAPNLHAVTGIVVTNDMFLGVIVLAHNGQFLHVEPRPLDFFDARFCLDVGIEYSYHCVMILHGLPPYLVLILPDAPLSLLSQYLFDLTN